jgi:hypothetical protein
MIVSKPLVDPKKEDLVYRVHPGFPDTNNWGWGAEKRHLLPIPDGIESSEWKAGPFFPGETIN